MAKGFKCECGLWHDFSAYVYAHWKQPLTHQCKCTRKHTVCEGVAVLIPQVLKKGKPTK